MTGPDPLTPFFDWLVQRGKSSPTAVSYVSCVRRILRGLGISVGVVPPDMAWFEQLAETKPRSYYNIRSAWRAYAEWMAQTQGLAMPMPVGSRGGSTHLRDPNTTSAAPLPETTRDAVRALVKAGLSFASIHAAQWTDVYWDTIRHDLDGSSTVMFRDPLNPGVQMRVPLAALVTLAEYAQAGRVFASPIIPLSPGSELHYPVERLRREASVHKETPLQIATRLRETAAAGPPGSALGSQQPPPAAASGHTVSSVLALLGAAESEPPEYDTDEDESEAEVEDENESDPNDVDSAVSPENWARFERASRELGIPVSRILEVWAALHE